MSVSSLGNVSTGWERREEDERKESNVFISSVAALPTNLRINQWSKAKQWEKVRQRQTETKHVKDQHIRHSATLLKFGRRWSEAREERWLCITQNDAISHGKTDRYWYVVSPCVHNVSPFSFYVFFIALRIYIPTCKQFWRPACVHFNSNNVTCMIHVDRKQYDMSCLWDGSWLQ